MMAWRGLPSLSALRAFEAAARTGSFSAAARELNVTHAAIAQHVRGLEDHFGCRMMERRGRGMLPTVYGQALANALAEGFGTIATACRDLSERDAIRPLRIAVTPSFAANWLMPRIGSFWETHPEVELEILPSHTLVDLRADGIDIAIRYGRGGWPGVSIRPLIPAGHVAVATPRVLEGRDVRGLADLSGFAWLVDANYSEETLWAATHGIDLARERTQSFATGQLVREAARAGLGVAILPEPLVEDELKAGRLIAIVRETDSPLAYHVLTRPSQVSVNRDAFVKWLFRQAAPPETRRETDEIPSSGSVR